MDIKNLALDNILAAATQSEDELVKKVQASVSAQNDIAIIGMAGKSWR